MRSLREWLVDGGAVKIAKEYPVLLAELVPSGQDWRVWCPWCRKFHYHAASEGHRSAHCNEGSPFRETGYYLVAREKQLRKIGALG